MEIGERLKKLRTEKDYTLEYVGKLVGVSKQTLYKYENGIVTNIPANKIKSLANLYGTTPSYLMGWDESVPEPTKSEKKLFETYMRAKESDRAVIKSLVEAIDKLLYKDE